MRKTTIAMAIAALAAMALAVPASASVTFDPSTGTGFVGKGDVQIPFGWNNQTLQAQAGNVSFAYTQVDATDYEVTCEWDTGTKHVVHHVQTTQHSLSDTVAYDVTKANRKNPRGDVTGFNLTGQTNVTSESSGDPVPTVGDPCPGNSGLGPITDVQVVSSSSTGGLYVSDTALGLGPTQIWSL